MVPLKHVQPIIYPIIDAARASCCCFLYHTTSTATPATLIAIDTGDRKRRIACQASPATRVVRRHAENCDTRIWSTEANGFPWCTRRRRGTSRRPIVRDRSKHVASTACPFPRFTFDCEDVPAFDDPGASASAGGGGFRVLLPSVKARAAATMPRGGGRPCARGGVIVREPGVRLSCVNSTSFC